MEGRFNPEMRGTAIPMFDQHGTALSQEKRDDLARKKGVCVKCGIQTHDVKKMFRRTPLTNEQVHNGKCIMCRPGDCPPEVVQAWEQKFKPQYAGSSAFGRKSSISRTMPRKNSNIGRNGPMPRRGSGDGSVTSQGRRNGPMPRRGSGDGSVTSHGMRNGPMPRRGSGDGSVTSHGRRNGPMPRRGSGDGSVTSQGRNGRTSPNSKSPPPQMLRKDGRGSRVLNRYEPSSDPRMLSPAGQPLSRHASTGPGIIPTSKPAQPLSRYASTGPGIVSSKPGQPLSRHSSTGPSIGGRRLTSNRASTTTAGTSRYPSGEFSLSHRGDNRLSRNCSDQSNYSNRTSSSEMYRDEAYCGDNLPESIEDLIESVKINKSKPEMLKRKLHKIRNLGEEGGILNEIQEFMKMYSFDSRVLEVCCGVIWGVTAKNDSNKILAADLGYIDTIVSLFQNPQCKSDPNLVKWIIGSLSGLSRGPGNRLRIADAGAIRKILDCLSKHDTSVGVFEWVCRALYSLIHKYEDEPEEEYFSIQENILSIEECNGIQSLVSAMSNHYKEPNAEMWAVRVLWRMQDREDNSDIQVLKQLNKAGGARTCVKILKSINTTPALFEVTAELLLNMISADGDIDAAIFETTTDCIAVTVRKMREESDNPRFLETCCNLLSAIVSKNKSKFKESKGLREVVAVLEKYSSNISLCCAAVNVLWTVSYGSTYFDETYLVDSVSAVSAANEETPNDLRFLLSSCGFLANVLAFSSTRLEEIPIEIPLDALLHEAEDPILANQAARALSNMCIKYPSLLKGGIKTSDIEFLVDRLGSSQTKYLHAVYDVLIQLGILSDKYKEKIVASGSFTAAKSCIESCKAGKIVEKALKLMSVLTTSESKQTIVLPNDLLQVLMSVKISFPSLAEQSCVILRDLLGSTSIETEKLDDDGLIEFGCDIINDPDSSVNLKVKACEALWAFSEKEEDYSLDNLSLIFDSILELMNLHKGESGSYESDIQAAAAGTLANVTDHMRERKGMNVELSMDIIEEFIHTIYTIMDCDINRTELILKLLDCLLNLSIINQSLVIQCGGVVATIDIMVEHEHVESVQERGCSILAILSSSENLQVNLCIAETDGVDMIISSLATFSSNERILVGAVKTLSHLSVDEESRMLITSQGAVMLILMAMSNNQDHVELLEVAFQALLNLSSDAEDVLLSDLSTIETIISFMNRHLDFDVVQEFGLGILQNISLRKSETKSIIAEAGGIEVALRAIKDYMGTALIVERALTTIWSLASIEEVQCRVADAGGIQVIVNGMMAQIEDEIVQKQASGCLCSLSANPRNKTLIQEAGGVDAIVYSMWAHYGSELVQAEGCRVLSSLALNVTTQEIMIATDNEINNIIAAMRRFPDSEKCQEFSCLALRNFMLSIDNLELIRNNSGELIGLLSHAADQFPEKCSERADYIIQELC